MITLLAPSKTMDFESPFSTDRFSTPGCIDRAETLMNILAGYSPAELADLMKLKGNLADLNADRIRTWSRAAHNRPGTARPAIHAYRGEVYRGLDAETLDGDGLEFAQEHVRILSGLYGVLRPLDLVLPYRLEMGTRLDTPRGNSLYCFWGDTIARALNPGDTPLINLASQEYIRAVATATLTSPVITPVFRDQGRNGPRVIAVYAKRQRGKMARYIVDHRIRDPEALKRYDLDGYRYDPAASTDHEWVFIR